MPLTAQLDTGQAPSWHTEDKGEHAVDEAVEGRTASAAEPSSCTWTAAGAKMKLSTTIKRIACNGVDIDFLRLMARDEIVGREGQHC
jgi:hypothetical protein